MSHSSAINIYVSLLPEVHCLTGLLFYNCVITFLVILPEVYCLASLLLDLLFVNSSQLHIYLVSGTLPFEMIITALEADYLILLLLLT